MSREQVEIKHGHVTEMLGGGWLGLRPGGWTDDTAMMLSLLQGRPHHVYSGLCLWRRPDHTKLVRVASTRLRMDDLTERQMDEYLDSGLWQDKAGAFGYQDRLGWVHVVEGSESNVVGLPMELLAEMLAELDGR